VLFAGVGGAGKGETAILLNEWMDPRGIVTRAYEAPSQEEAERPEFWRYWRDLPPKGRIALFQSSWYSHPVLDHVYGRTTDTELEEALQAVGFEDTWFSLTTTHPRLALIAVSGPVADETREILLNELRDLGDARTAIGALLEAIDDSQAELADVDTNIATTTAALSELGASRAATAGNLA